MNNNQKAIPVFVGGIIAKLASPSKLLERSEKSDNCYCYEGKGRPNLQQNQVRCVCQVVKGQEYYRMGNRIEEGEEGWKPALRFTILRGPYKKHGFLWVDIRLSDDQSFEGEVFIPDTFLYFDRYPLVELGIVPYKNGEWNENSYISFVEKDAARSSGCSCKSKRSSPRRFLPIIR